MPETERTEATSESREECACRAAWKQLRDMLPPPPSERTRSHFRNSRVEFLKALRSIIDDRIDQINSAGQKGTRVVVE